MIQIAQREPQDQRKNRAHQSLPGKRRQSGHSQSKHGQEGTAFERHDRVRSRVFGAAALFHESHVEAAVGIVNGGDHRECGDAREPSLRNRPLAKQVAQHQSRQNAYNDFCREQCAAALCDSGQSLEGDGRAETHVEHGQNGQGAGEESAGEGSEKAGRSGREGDDNRAQDQRDNHHSPGNALYRAFDWHLHLYEGSVSRVRFALRRGSTGTFPGGGRDHRGLPAPTAQAEFAGVA